MTEIASCAPRHKVAASDAWQLSLWYQELALLRLLGHRGSYRNRTTAKRVGQVEPRTMERLLSSIPGGAARAVRDDVLLSRLATQARPPLAG